MGHPDGPLRSASSKTDGSPVDAVMATGYRAVPAFSPELKLVSGESLCLELECAQESSRDHVKMQIPIQQVQSGA